MTIPNLEEVNRDILASTLSEMDFYTGRWTGREGVPRSLAGALGERSAALLRMLSAVRFEVQDMQRLLDVGGNKDTQ